MPKFSLPLQIESGFDKQPDPQFNSATVVNMYLVYDSYGKNQQWRLRRFPGLKRKLATGANGYRGAFVLQNAVIQLAYYVKGNKFYQFDGAVETNLGTLNTSAGHVRIVCNQVEPFPQIVIVDGTDGWVWDGSAFTQITDTDFPANPIDCDYLDGRILVLDGGTNKWTASDINDAFTYGTFSNAAITTKAGDTLVGIAVLHRRIYLFGNNSMESWYNAVVNSLTVGNFPFVRNNNIALDFGCAAIGSIATGFDRLFFLANTQAGVGAIMRITGDIPEPVSTPQFENELHAYTRVDDAVAYVTRTEEGNVQYVINFPTANVTWVYDDTTNKIVKRQMLNGGRHVGQIHFYFKNTHYLGSFNTNILYIEDQDYLDNDGEAIKYQCRLSILTDKDHKRIRIDRIELDCIRGIGVAAPPYDKPNAYLSVSRDAGMTFGAHIPAPLTQMGDFIGLTRWRRLGGGNGARDFVFDISCVCKNNFGIFGGTIQGEVLPE